MKKITITTVDGDVDEWEGAMDTVVDDAGSLVLIYRVDEDEIPEGTKTIVLHSQIDRGPDLPPLTKSVESRVAAVYAAGMWVKVEYS